LPRSAKWKESDNHNWNMKKPVIEKCMSSFVLVAAMVLMASAGCMTKPQSSNPPPARSKQSAAEIQDQEHQKDVDRAARELFRPLSGKSDDGK